MTIVQGCKRRTDRERKREEERRNCIDAHEGLLTLSARSPRVWNGLNAGCGILSPKKRNASFCTLSRPRENVSFV